MGELETLLSHSGVIGVFISVILIDIVLAGDNAVVIGTLAAGLPPEQRRKVILIGIIAALVMRIGFALVAIQLLQVIGLLFAGGLLLLWVSWKMWRDLRPAAVEAVDDPSTPAVEGVMPKSFASAAFQVAVADLSMSLDNVLAVAGAARDHPGIMAFGLILSVALMGVAANYIARIINSRPWIAYIGLGVIVIVALRMMWHGWHEMTPHVMPLLGMA